jgi:hypothetical protein
VSDGERDEHNEEYNDDTYDRSFVGGARGAGYGVRFPALREADERLNRQK